MTTTIKTKAIFHQMLRMALKAFYASCIVLSLTVAAWAQPTPVSITWELLDRPVTLYEPVLLQLTVENRSGAATVSLNLGKNEKAGLSFAITKPDGSVDRRPPLEIPDFGSPGIFEIGPGAKHTHVFVVDEWFPFEQPGEYAIQVSLRYPITARGQTVTVDSGAILRCRIDARDENALRRRCALLADKLLASRDPFEAAQMALALSYVRDPIAISYLKESLSSQLPIPRDIVIRGIGRFATAEAVDALISVIRASGPESPLAVVMLSLLTPKIDDPQLRERVRAALESAARP